MTIGFPHPPTWVFALAIISCVLIIGAFTNQYDPWFPLPSALANSLAFLGAFYLVYLFLTFIANFTEYAQFQMQLQAKETEYLKERELRAAQVKHELLLKQAEEDARLEHDRALKARAEALSQPKPDAAQRLRQKLKS